MFVKLYSWPVQRFYTSFSMKLRHAEISGQPVAGWAGNRIRKKSYPPSWMLSTFMENCEVWRIDKTKGHKITGNCRTSVAKTQWWGNDWYNTVSISHSLTHSREQSPSWEANRFSASQEIPRILYNPKVHYCTHKFLSLSWARSIHSMPPHLTSWRSILTILFSHLRLSLPSILFPSGFPTQSPI
jgi:hypothetical protein